MYLSSAFPKSAGGFSTNRLKTHGMGNATVVLDIKQRSIGKVICSFGTHLPPKKILGYSLSQNFAFPIPNVPYSVFCLFKNLFKQ
jgi:hypothetical protein